MIHTGDCVEVMAGMEASSVDAIVTDPPYGLEFMGKEWDRLAAIPDRDQGPRGRNAFGGWHGTRSNSAAAQQEFHAAWATEALRIAKPGAYLLAFGGTRTYHRMTCAIEDAGWIIRDCLVWAYASGFPKSKALLKPAWEPIVMARKPGPLRELAIDACRIQSGPDYTELDVVQGGDHFSIGSDAKTRGTRFEPASGRWPANLILTDPIFDGDTPGVVGGGQASNPADVSRWTADGQHNTNTTFGKGGFAISYGDTGTYSRFFLIPKADRAEREPVLGGLPLRSPASHNVDGRDMTNPRNAMGDAERRRIHNGEPGIKLRANVHPTVKPIDLMRHLVRLVTPQGGVVLDPFLGSGTTALAAEMEGFAWIGIEKEPEYVAIAEARLNGTQRGLGLVDAVG